MLHARWQRASITRLPDDYDVADRQKAFTYLKQHPDEIVTGVLFADESVPDLHETNQTPATALGERSVRKIVPWPHFNCNKLQEEFR